MLEMTFMNLTARFYSDPSESLAQSRIHDNCAILMVAENVNQDFEPQHVGRNHAFYEDYAT